MNKAILIINANLAVAQTIKHNLTSPNTGAKRNSKALLINGRFSRTPMKPLLTKKPSPVCRNFARTNADLPELDRLFKRIYEDMVNAVYVHASYKSSGHRVQDVTISYNYFGILPANLLYDVMNGKAA